ncbi:MAG TPA: tripartite tricarboxylate transporter substrate binding protein [Burkholderiales bacterium]
MRTLLAGLIALACCAASAQSFPSKAIRILVPSVAGSSPDIRARQVAAKLAEAFGQPVIVENRPGGNGIIAARETVRAPADGYTLFLALINNAVGDVLKPDPCCKLNEALVPVSRFTMTPLVVVVNPSLGVSSLKELLERARAKPDALTYASGGPGSITELLGEWIKSASGARLLEVPYKSVGAEVPDLLSGQVSVGLIVPQSILAPVRAGKLRALAVSGSTRVSVLPEVPTLQEAGLAGVDAIVWNGLFVAAGTPPALIQVLHREVVRAYNAPEVKEQVARTGSEVAADTPEAFAAFVRAENAKWSKVIRDAGIKPE